MFTKPAMDIDAQITLLRSRGLAITDARWQKTKRAATKPDFDSRVVCGNEKAGAGWFVRHGFFVGAHDPQPAAVA